jgi:heptosyltransferase-2
MMPQAAKVLVIRFSSIGDILLSSPLVRAMRKRFPACQIDFVAKTQYADLVRYNPHLSNVIEFPDGGTVAELRALRKRIYGTDYDLIIDIHDNLRSRFLCLAARNVVRVKKRKLARWFLINTKWNLYPSLGGSPSVAERYLEPLAHLGVQNDNSGLEVFFPPEIEKKAERLLASLNHRQTIIGLAPAAVHATKMWTMEGFAQVGVTLATELNADVALFGSAQDLERCKLIEQMICAKRTSMRVLNLAGKTTLLEAASVMDRCAVVISNDSGLMHLAAARKRPVVAIFGSTVQEFGFFPYGTRSIVVENRNLECRPCTHIGRSRCPKKHFRCMNDISPGAVVAAVRSLLQP